MPWRCEFLPQALGKQSDVLAPLSELTGDKPWEWTDKHQKVFEASKAILAKETML